MKKVIALALALIMVLAMGVTSFATTLIHLGGGSGPNDLTDYFFPFDTDWDIAQEAVIFIPYDFGDAGTLISGTDVVAELWGDGGSLSSIKVESQKGLVKVSVYDLDSYVKSVSDDGATVKTKSSWPFADFDIQDLLDASSLVGDDVEELNLFFVYFDFPTYAGAKVSTDNYFTLKFRENTTGADHIKTSKKVWFCIYPWAVEEDDVETYADEDEAMVLEYGYPMLTQDLYLDLMADEYEDAADQEWWFEQDEDRTPYVITKDAWKEIVGSTLIVGVDDAEVEIGKIVKGQSAINFLYKTKVEKEVQAVNEDAELSALRFLDTTNVLDSDFTITFTFEIEDAAKAGDYFLYELVGDELKLVQKVAVGKGDDEVDVEIERKAGDTLGQYYLSDVELATATAPEEEGENPNTGASEVAGVAVALAVISLVSAAAVSLKK